jgi:hypothetical protein
VKKQIAVILIGGVVCALLTVVLPVGLAPFFPEPAPKSESGVRLPQSPAEYPDPNITWIYRWPGMTRESSIRGIGILDSWHVSRLRVGWPLPMLEGGDYCELHSNHGEAASGALHQVSMKSWWSSDFKKQWRLPTAPVWGGGGIAGNWAAWSVAIGLFFVPGAVKRGLRRRRGQCLRCGYPRADGTAVCPECGGAPA